MPNDSLTEALKETNALAPNDRVILETLQISHPTLGTPLYFVRDRQSWDLTLEDDSVVTFQPIPFRFILPTPDTNGGQEMQLAIDNIEPDVPDFIESLAGDPSPVEIRYRPYLSDDPTTPQMDPPLLLYLTEIQQTALEVSGRATFANMINARYLTQKYTRTRFPGLA